MNTISSTPSATSPYPATTAYHEAAKSSPFNFAKAIKASGSARQPKVVAPTSNASPVTQQKLPLGLLLSVSPPSAASLESSNDYQSLRTALRSGNLSAAQQAYLRLQGDSVMLRAAHSSIKSSSQGKGSQPVSLDKSTSGKIFQDAGATAASDQATDGTTASGQASILNVTG